MSIMGTSHVASRAEPVATKENQAMGKDDFLKLLVAQLKAQDPLKPMEGTEFTAQLAQFSSLEQLQNLNIGLAQISTSQAVMANSQAVSYIGKSVTADGDSLVWQEGGECGIQFDLAADSDKVFVTIYDAAGDFVRDIEAGGLGAGSNELFWNGRDQNGNKVREGLYRFDVSAIDLLGNPVGAKKFVTGKVDGITFKNGMAYLLAGDRKIPLSNVISVAERDSNTSNS